MSQNYTLKYPNNATKVSLIQYFLSKLTKSEIAPNIVILQYMGLKLLKKTL